MASKKCQKSGARSTGFHTRSVGLEIDRDIHASLEPNNEVSLRHLTMLLADSMAIPLAEIVNFDDGRHGSGEAAVKS